MAEEEEYKPRNIGIAIDKEDLAWFEDSPDTGDEACICSYCGNVISEFEIPLRLFKEEEKTEARLCENCMDLLIR